MVRPVLKYGSSVWDPHTQKLQDELEKVQNFCETRSMTGILRQLKWLSLKKRRKDNGLIFLYKGLKGKARIPTDDFIPKAFQIPSASKDTYKNSFFPRAIRDWNDLPDSLISPAESSHDCVSTSKFTSLVRTRD